MQIQNPKKQIPQQVNQGNEFGDIYASWNMDLVSNIGKIRVSPRLIVHSLGGYDAETALKYPIAILRSVAATASTDNYWAICDSAVFKVSATNLGSTMFAQDATAPTRTSKIYSDAKNFDGNMVVSTAASLTLYNNVTNAWDANWGETLGVVLTDNIPHPLCTGFNNLHCAGNGNKLVTVETDNTVDTEAVILPNEYEMIWIESSSNAYWIGARNKSGGDGKVFMWDGYSENYNNAYSVYHSMTFAGVIKDGICYTVNGKGQLLGFNGSGFTEVDKFPIANSKIEVLNNSQATGYPLNITRNGMAVVDGNIHINLCAATYGHNENNLDNMPSGIWEYTKETGLYHKYGLSKDKPSNTTDYGAPKIAYAGAICPLGTQNKFLVGAELYTQPSTDLGVINWIIPNEATNSKYKLGYYITPKYYGNIDEVWQKIWSVYKPLSTNFRIIIKYRTSESMDGESSFDAGDAGQWLSTTSFKTKSTQIANRAVGDEIEVLKYVGAGLSANITAISAVSNGWYTVTLESLPLVSGLAGSFDFRVANWTQIESIDDTTSYYTETGIGENNPWIQFKIIMMGLDSGINAGLELEKLIIKSESQLNI